MNKRILLIVLFCFSALLCSGQGWDWDGSYNYATRDRGGTMYGQVLGWPCYTITPTWPFTFSDSGRVAFINGLPFYKMGGSWVQFASASGSGISSLTAGNGLLGGTVTTFGTFLIDSQKIRGWIHDTANAVRNGIPTNNNQLANGAGYITGINSAAVTTALGYTPVTNARQLTINGTTYDLTANRSWTITNGIGDSLLKAWDSLYTHNTRLLALEQAGYITAATARGIVHDSAYTAGTGISINPLTRVITNTSPSSGGTVTSISSANLSPLFTSSVATSATTPAITYTLTPAGAHSYLGNNTGSTAAPAYYQIAYSELTGAPVIQVTINGVTIANGTSNTVTVPISTGVTGLGTGIATWAATPSSANLAAALTDETGSGAAVFATSPTLVTPALGTPTSGNLSNCTSIPAAQLTGSVTVANGGTGLSTLPAHAMLVGNGASNVTSLSPGTSANIVQSNGADFVSNAMSGDVTIGSTGITAIGSGKVTNAMLAGSIDLTSKVTGTLPVGNGGTGVTSLGTGIATWWQTPSSSNLAAAITDETGTGVAVFNNKPTFLGTIQTSTAMSAQAVDGSLGNWFTRTLASSETFTQSNISTNQNFVLEVKQGSGTSYTVTWWSGITWVTSGGTAPVQTTTSNGITTYGFHCTGSNTFTGYLIGTN